MGNLESSATSTPNYCVYYNKGIPVADYNYCPWCGSKLHNGGLHSEIDIRDLHFSKKDLLGQGTYAKVYRGRIRGVDVAVKVPNLDKILPHKKESRDRAASGESGEAQFLFSSGEASDARRSSESSEDDDDDDELVSQQELSHAYSDRFQNFLSEVRHLREVNHPNVCLLMGTCFVEEQEQRKLLLVYELMEEDLNDQILRSVREEGRGEPSLLQRILICCQVASGLDWVSSKGIIHGDLKPSNILRKGSVYKVTDFGLAAFEERSDNFEGGAPIWSAPEILEHRTGITLAVDVFSFGYLMWHILMWKDEDQLFTHVQNTQQLLDTVCKRHEIPQMMGLPERLQDLIRWCLSYAPEERPRYQQIIGSLNSAMLAVTVSEDEFAREFWAHYFCSRTGVLQIQVETSKFMEKFARFLGLGARDKGACETVREFFQTGTHVTLEHYGRMMALFGPLDAIPSEQVSRSTSPLSRRRSRVNASPLVATLERLRRETWFCGLVSTQRVEQTLLEELPGSFLVRYSNNAARPGAFCLSRVTAANRVRHHYITKRENTYSLQVSQEETVTASSISALLANHRVLKAFYLVTPIGKLASFRRVSAVAEDRNVDSGYSLYGFQGSNEGWEDLATMAASPPSTRDFPAGL